jgi:DNA-binding beta-propeller fold protein YncE
MIKIVKKNREVSLILGLMFLIQAAYAGPRIVGTYPLNQNTFSLSNPYGIAFDSKRNEVWVSGANSDNLVIINAGTKKNSRCH